MRLLRLLYDLLDPDGKRQLLYLVPMMLLSSAADVLVVGAGAGFASMVVNPAGIGASRLGRLAESALHTESSSTLWVVGIATLAVTLVGNAVSLFSLRQVAVYGQSQAYLLSARMLQSYLSQHYSFFLVRPPAQLATRVLVECNQVIATVLMGLLQVASRVLGAVFIIGALIAYDPGLSMVMVVVLGGVYVSTYAFLRTLYRRLGAKRVRLMAELHHLATESLEGVKEIQVYDLSKDAAQSYRTAGVELAHAMALFQTVSSSMRFLIEALGMGSIVLVALYYDYTGRPVASLVPVLGAYGIASVRLLPLFQTTFVALSKAQLQFAALEGLHQDMLEATPLLLAKKDDPAPAAYEHELTLTNASFTYPNSERPVFEGLNLEIQRGSWVAFVGTTGAGKSTLVDTLLGLLTPMQGEMRVDGALVDAKSARAWQKQVAYVPQHIFIRAASMRDNISFSAEVSDAEIDKAVQIARLDGFIRDDLERGLDTQLGARGSRLSGGQRQRVGLARAVARRPAFLVLDEATSALDNETEAEVVKALRHELPGTTVVMIAHRLSSTRYCDRILVMDRGVVVEHGTFDELAALGGRFATMLSAGDASSPG